MESHKVKVFDLIRNSRTSSTGAAGARARSNPKSPARPGLRTRRHTLTLFSEGTQGIGAGVDARMHRIVFYLIYVHEPMNSMDLIFNAFKVRKVPLTSLTQSVINII